MVAAYLLRGCEDGWSGEVVKDGDVGGSGLSGSVQKNDNAAVPIYNRN